MSAKTLAACAILAAAATGADAFATGSLPAALRRPHAGACSVRMQAGESVADILARAKAMEEGTVATHHSGTSAPQHHAVEPTHTEDNASIAEIIARAREISAAAASMRASFNKPSAAPASTRTVSRGTATMIREFLKPDDTIADEHVAMATIDEAVEMIRLGHQGLERRRSPSPRAPAARAPAAVAHAPAPAASQAQGESVADILARAAAMESSGAVSKGGAKLRQTDSIVDKLRRA